MAGGIVNQPALVDLARPARKVGAAGISDSSVTDAKLTDNASDQGKHGIWVPAGSLTPTVSAGCAVITTVETTADRPDMRVLDFDGGSDEHAQFDLVIGNSWNGGTVSFQVYHTIASAITTTVAWALQGISVANDETIDVAYSGGTPVVVVDTYLNAAEDEHISDESAAVTLGGTVAALNHLYFRFFRDVSADNTAADARFIGLMLFVTTTAGTDA